MTQAQINGSGPAGDPEGTLIGVVLDRSGSMTAVREPTIAGFNEFLHQQQQLAAGGRALMSLTQFDNRFEVNFVGEPIENVPDLDTESFVPRGTTALFDAIGRTVHEIESWGKAHGWKERVLVMIITDGHENASKEYHAPDIKALIERKEKEGWNFAYMGANQDSYAAAGTLSIRRDFTGNYDATAAGTATSYSRMSAATTTYRMSRSKGQSAPAFYDSADDPQPAASGSLKPKEAPTPRRP
jgi:hypothetical protein